MTPRDQDVKATATKRRISIERTYPSSIDDLWNLWTTKAGIESWWGPDGFKVDVLELDLQPGGKLHYAMTATAPAQVEFMTKAGMPLTNATHATYTEVARPGRFSYDSLVDFVPGVEPYAIANSVELLATEQGVRVVLTFDAMHDDEWTGRLVAGRESQLDKLAKVIERGSTRA